MNNCAIILASQNEKIINSNKPKAMCEILFEPIICRVISAVQTAGIEDICIVSDSSLIENHFTDSNIRIFRAIENTVDFVNQHNNVLVINGSLLFADAKTLVAAINYHIENDNDITSVTVDEKTPDGKYAEIIRASVFSANNIPESEFYYYNTDNDRFFTAPDTFRELNKTNETLRLEMLEKIIDSGVDIPCKDGIIIGPGCKIGADTKILPNTVIYGNVTIGENCVIGPNSYVFNAEIGNGVSFNNAQIRNAKIMNNADIGPFSQIRPDSVIGDDVHLGNFTEVKNSVIDTGTKVSHLTYVGDSDVGKDVNFGCGVVTVNFTGKTKHRTVIKDNAFIGCNTNLVAPVTVGKNSYTAAGSTITEDVPDNTLAIARERQTNKEGWVTTKQPYRKKV